MKNSSNTNGSISSPGSDVVTIVDATVLFGLDVVVVTVGASTVTVVLDITVLVDIFVLVGTVIVVVVAVISGCVVSTVFSTSETEPQAIPINAMISAAPGSM